MSGLTDWERDRLADLERQLALDDPALVARLRPPVQRRPIWARRGIGWLTTVVGVVLLLCGAALGDGWITTSGALLLSLCWLPFWLGQRTGSPSGS